MNIDEKIENFAPYAEMMPGVVVILEIDGPKPIYMTPNGLKKLGLNLNELKAIETRYHEEFFNTEDMDGFMVKLKKLLEKKELDEAITFFQQVKLRNPEEWAWYITSLKIFAKDANQNPTHIVAFSFAIDQMPHIPNKAERLLKENVFYKENLKKFLSLGERAKEVLRMVAMGKSSAEIADDLCISVDTVNTHRKIIKQKLDITTSYEFTQFAYAYDLI